MFSICISCMDRANSCNQFVFAVRLSSMTFKLNFEKNFQSARNNEFLIFRRKTMNSRPKSVIVCRNVVDVSNNAFGVVDHCADDINSIPHAVMQ